ncbi:hypothetical protein GGR57DRAFT_508288 [Xylariaceae sp. FL1272]|nr:hypothetical protein GGR57DRAFT_508288 [Xylariaceae sp. FL1272]
MTLPYLGRREAHIAAGVTRAILSKDGNKHSSHSDVIPRLLLHVFSNAGSTMLYHVYTAFATASSSDASESTVLPLHVAAFDSAPARFTYQTLFQGIIDGAPSAARIVITPVVYIYVAFVLVVITLLRLPGHIDDLGPRSHNDPARVLEARRVYICGTADRITLAADVERHADEAEARCFCVQVEVFEGTKHVAHSRKDADRYWRVVGQLWEDAQHTTNAPMTEARLVPESANLY